MSYRSGIPLGGAVTVVALACVLVPGVTGAAATPATSSPTPGPTLTCPPALPLNASVVASTPTSVTIRYSLFLLPPCGYDPPVTVFFFAGQDDAQQWADPVGEAVSGPERSGELTVTGLTPDTPYWLRFTAGGRQDPYTFPAVRTAATAVCTVTSRIDSRWAGGFVATFTVRNVGAETLTGWHASWRWPGDERIQSLWNGTAQGTAPDVTVTNAAYNATLPPGRGTTFGMLVATSGAPPETTPSCGL